LGVERLPDGAALADAGRTEEHQQMQVTLGKGPDIRLQFGIGRQAERVRRRFRGCGHDGSLGGSKPGATPDVRGRPRYATAMSNYESAPSREAKRPGPVFVKRDAVPLSFTSRAIAA